jgi:predicted P-loop ATPase
MLVAAVRRIRKPGCKFDEMLVLESDQGTDKSSALKALAVNESWFSDDMPLNVTGKEVIERQRGRWIIECAELKGMRKGDLEHIKAFLSRQTDRARLSYDRLTTEVPRQSVFFGTTNSSKYLRDVTGGRRFWPVAVTKFDLAALTHDRDQLWAEAVAREAKGESIRLDPLLYDAAAVEQKARSVDDPFREQLEHVLDGHTGKLLNADAWEIVGVPIGQRTQEHNARMGEAMKSLGWERTEARIEGRKRNVYARGSKAESQKRVRLVKDQQGRVIGATVDEKAEPGAEPVEQAELRLEREAF